MCACFNHAGAEDLDKVISQNQPIELSDDSDESSASEDELFGRKKKRTRGRKPPPKKQKTKAQPTVSTSPNEKIEAFYISDDDDDSELAFLDSSNVPVSDTVKLISGTLHEYDHHLAMARNLQTQQRQRKLNLSDLEDSPVAPATKPPKSIGIIMSCDGFGEVKLTVSMRDTFGKILDVLSTVLDNITIDENTIMKLDGMPLYSAETPNDYAMKDGDKIVVTSKLRKNDPFENEANLPTQPQDTNLIKLTIRTKDQDYKFAINRDDTFQKLFDGFCKHAKLQPDSVKLMLDGDDLDLELTPEDEDLDDGDLIDVQFH